MSDQSVAVVIPAYNRAACLARALESIIAQTVKPQEVIVVDDKSKDSSITDTLADYGHRFQDLGINFIGLRNAVNSGAALSRNRGFAASGCPLVAFLDSDDAWESSHLEVCMGVLQANQGIALVASNHYDKGKNSHRNPRITVSAANNVIVHDAYDFKFSAIKAPLRTSGLLISREGFESIGGFDEALEKHQDWDLVMRFNNKNGRFIYNLGSTVFIHSEADDRMSHSSNYNASLRFLKRHYRTMKRSHRVRFCRAVIKNLRKDKKNLQAWKFIGYFFATISFPRKFAHSGSVAYTE